MENVFSKVGSKKVIKYHYPLFVILAKNPETGITNSQDSRVKRHSQSEGLPVRGIWRGRLHDVCCNY